MESKMTWRPDREGRADRAAKWQGQRKYVVAPTLVHFDLPGGLVIPAAGELHDLTVLADDGSEVTLGVETPGGGQTVYRQPVTEKVTRFPITFHVEPGDLVTVESSAVGARVSGLFTPVRARVIEGEADTEIKAPLNMDGEGSGIQGGLEQEAPDAGTDPTDKPGV
jgi:hypothetical protein